jgi:hypothetical protein
MANRRREHGMEAYASTMTTRGRVERRRLQPGDRLADGTIWAGDARTTTLTAKRNKLIAELDRIQTELTAIDLELGLVEEPPQGNDQKAIEDAVGAYIEEHTPAGLEVEAVEPNVHVVAPKQKRKQIARERPDSGK